MRAGCGLRARGLVIDVSAGSTAWHGGLVGGVAGRRARQHDGSA
ncbi:hypothetical protein [Frankia sp. AiPa1]|nr:hypothetical protein [Frankia sp. AiPa1]